MATHTITTIVLVTTPTTPLELIEAHGKTAGVSCGCIGYVSGHPRGTRGKTATYTTVKGCATGTAWRVERCDSCGRYLKRESHLLKAGGPIRWARPRGPRSSK